MHRVVGRSESQRRRGRSFAINVTFLLFSSSSEQELYTALLLEVYSNLHFQLCHCSYSVLPEFSQAK